MKRFSTLSLTFGGLGLFMAASAAEAAVINVDFHNDRITGGQAVLMSNAGAAPDTGTVWNEIVVPNSGGDNSGGFNFDPDIVTPFLSGPLNDSQGNVTATTVSLLETSGTANAFAYGGNYSGDAQFADLLRDGLLVAGSSTVEVTLNNLTANGVYDLYLYSAGDKASRSAVFSNGAQSKAGTANNNGDVLEGEEYVVLESVLADATGELSFIYARADGSNEGAFNGFQAVLVPEPASVALLGLGGLCLLGRRRPA